MGLYCGVKGSMIPFKDSPLVLTRDLVLNTYPEYNRSLYDSIYVDPLNKLFDYTTTYIDGTISKGPCNNSYPDYRCSLERMYEKYNIKNY